MARPMTTNAPDAIPAPREAIEEALVVLNDHGFDIGAPWDGDLDDREREQFEAVEKAVSAVIQFIADRASRSPLAAPVAEGWRDMASAPKDGTHVLLNLGETIPDLVDARVGQFITEKDAEELGEIVSASGGWIIWDTGGDWFVVPYADVFGWALLPPAPGTAPSGTAEVGPVTRQWRAWEDEDPCTKWMPEGYGDLAGWEAIVGRNPSKYRIEWRSLYAHPPSVEVREPDAELVRPIVGIENRTAQEVFDIMADRIRNRLSKHGGNDA